MNFRYVNYLFASEVFEKDNEIMDNVLQIICPRRASLELYNACIDIRQSQSNNLK